MTFKTFISVAKPSDPPLPMVHTTSTRGFRAALSEGKLTAPDPCPVFTEHLVYFFYGRPAYKVTVDPAQRVTDEYLPIALIFDPALAASVCRVHPFDTGAFPREAYKPALHKHVQLKEFEVDPTLLAAQQIVATFFGSNCNYLLGDANPAAAPDSFDEPEAFAHLSIILGATNPDVDDRRYTIEMQVPREVPLAPTLKAVVVPHTLLASHTLQAFLSANPHVEHPTYSRFKGVTISALHAIILQRIRDFLEVSHYL